MTEQKPMSTTDAAQPEQGADTSHRVRIGEREVSLTEARAAMHPALRHQVEQQFPRADDTPELAQQFVEAYASAHEQQHGQAFTAERTDVHESAKSRTAHTERQHQRDRDEAKRRG